MHSIIKKIEETIDSLIRNQIVLNYLNKKKEIPYEVTLLSRAQQSLLACFKHLNQEQKPLSKRLSRKWERYEKLTKPVKFRKRRAVKVSS